MSTEGVVRICAVVPVYNHAARVGGVVDGILSAGLPCLLVDDGSHAECAAVLDAIAASQAPRVQVLHLPENGGKGAAVMAGFHAAAAQGYTHALQIDADGQHDVSDIPNFVSLSQAAPEKIICGCPIYDESVPPIRFYCRYATHVCVWINTLSFAIRDSMCGFRIYPLAPVMDLLSRQRIGTHMDFDTEIIVRLFWAGVAVHNKPTRVHYPADGVSHFRMWADNVAITGMLTRQFFGMLWRSPQLLWRRLRGDLA